MGRIRSIKPEFNSNEGLSKVSCHAHLMAEALLCYADDEGYFNANPGLVKAGTFPLRDEFDLKKIAETLRELVMIGYLRFGTCKNKRYGKIVNFRIHQRISHPAASRIKDLEIAWEDSGIPPEASGESGKTAEIIAIPRASHELPSERNGKVPDEFRTEPGAWSEEPGPGNGAGRILSNGTPSDDSGLDFELEPEPDEAVEPTRQALSRAVGEVFEYYLCKVGREATGYSLTPARRKKGLARLEDALKKTGNDLPRAICLLKIVVDELSFSDWHMGKDPKNDKKYCEWEKHLFPSTEKFEWWLQRAQEARK